MKLLKKIPFFLLLLVLFFCLHGWVENFGFIGYREVFKPGLIIFTCMVLFTGVVFLFTKNLLQASLIIFFISLWYLFFGAFYDWAKEVPYLSFLKSYPVIVALLFLFTTGWIIFLKKQPQLQKKLAVYLNLLLFIYIVVDLFSLVNWSEPEFSGRQTNAVSFDKSKITAKPNVYLLVFDGYPGATSLKDSFNFRNDSLYSYFAAKDLNVLPVFSNYDLTYFSMSSMFSMHYVEQDFNPMQITQHDFQRRGVEIKKASIFPLFKSMGYKIRNLSIFEIADHPPISDKNSFLLAHSILLTDKILHNRLNRDVGDRLTAVLPFWKKNDFYQHDTDNKRTEQLLLKTAAEKKEQPTFIYTHFMMPHGPYYYDSLGNKNPYNKISHHSMWSDKELFISYLKYVNSRLTVMTDEIIRNDPQAIIMVMGDHGFRSYSKKKNVIPPLFDNLCAVRFPNKQHVSIKERWSTVNLFRYVLNCEFGQNIPYLADSSIVLRY